MPKAADTSTKKLISLAPDNWVRWVTNIPNIKAGNIVSGEFQWISRESDVLIHATSPEHGEFLVLNELQLRYSSNMPRRIRAYAALAEEKYKLPTYPVLINILQTSNVEIPTSFTSNLAGLRAIQDYRVINLWEVDVNVAFQQPLPSLLPFVPILKGGNEESIIREALQILRRDEDLNQLETVLAFFATFVLESGLVQDIMRWDMGVLRESPWYQQILKEGEAQGEARGEARGETQGRKEQMLSNIEMSLEAKFGSEGLELMPRISEITNLEELQGILRSVVLASSFEELREIL
jgi:predicted transposase YdaD